jgi:hypothetical protein
MCITRVQEPQLTAARDVGVQGYKVIMFPISLYINVCRNIDMYIIATPNTKVKMACGIAWGNRGVGRVIF